MPFELQSFGETLSQAFPGEQLDEMFLYSFGLNLEGEVGGVDASGKDRVFRLLEWAISGDKINELVKCAYIQKPEHRHLRSFFEQIPQREPFLGGYDYDVFLSHGQRLDQNLLNPFVGRLTEALVRKLKSPVVVGRSGARAGAAGGESPMPRCAAMVVFLTDDYLESEACRRELSEFVAAHGDGVRRRLFVADVGKFGRARRPAELSTLIEYPFWDDQNWSLYLRDLSDDVSAVLGQFRKGTDPGTPPDTTAEHVLLAEVTDDLRPRREDARRYLQQKGLNVLPREWYPRDAAGFGAKMDADLELCSVFVQLLGADPGAEEGGPARDLASVQYERARASGKTVMQWRAEELDLASVRDAGHRALLEGDDVRVETFEEFKGAVYEAARGGAPKTPRTTRPPGPRLPSDLIFFVNVDQSDKHLAEDVIGKSLHERAITYLVPIAFRDPEQVRQNLRDNIENCDVMLLVYGSATPRWVISQWKECVKILARRAQPLRQLVLYDGPPPEKRELGLRPANMQYLDCRRNEDALRALLERL